MTDARFLRASLALLSCLLLLACGRNMASTTYKDSAVAGKVLSGTVISTRNVTIKSHDKLQDNTLGGLAGGAAGAVGGGSIGRGNGSLAAGIGGAVVGAVAGALIEDALSTSSGVEYLVKLDDKHKKDTYRSKKIVTNGKQSVEQDMQNSIDIDSQTDIVSVVQAADPAIGQGSRVYVIYGDDRPRLVPANPPQP